MRYHNITKEDMLNGEGMRVVLWVAGCSHNCDECQNPITHDPYGGIVFNEAAKSEIFEELEKGFISGITLSGGDPLHENNVEDILKLVKEVKQLYPTKNIWLYSGTTYEQIVNSDQQNPIWYKRMLIMSHSDAFVDGRYDKSKKNTTLHWKGSSNQNVIDVHETLKMNIKNEKDVILTD